MNEDIYGKDPYKPSLWQRLKDWINCKILGRHLLPYVHYNGSVPVIVECSRCDFTEKQSSERQLSLELINEIVDKTRPYWNPSPAPTSIMGLSEVIKNHDKEIEE